MHKQIPKLVVGLLLSSSVAVFAGDDKPPVMPEGFSALWVNNVTFQTSTKDMTRGFYSGFNPKIADTAGRLQNALILNYKKNNFTFMLDYLDLRTIGGGAYSLTNPFSNGVNTFEYDNGSYKDVDHLSGIYELAVKYEKEGLFLAAGKIDTSIYYLADPVFAGDLLGGVDYGNCATRVVAPPFPSLAVVGKYDFGNSWSITGIVGDAFGDRETLDAGKNLEEGDLSYILELNYTTPKTHWQLTYNHVDDFKYMDKDSPSMPGFGFGSSFDAVMTTLSYRLNPNWAVFGRASWAMEKSHQSYWPISHSANGSVKTGPFAFRMFL